MNLRKDITEQPEIKYKYKVGDSVEIDSTFKGIVKFSALHEDKKIYIIKLNEPVEIGRRSKDQEINLLKPLGLTLKYITVYENEVTLKPEDKNKYPHIMINSLTLSGTYNSANYTDGPF